MYASTYLILWPLQTCDDNFIRFAVVIYLVPVKRIRAQRWNIIRRILNIKIFNPVRSDVEFDHLKVKPAYIFFTIEELYTEWYRLIS